MKQRQGARDCLLLTTRRKIGDMVSSCGVTKGSWCVRGIYVFFCRSLHLLLEFFVVTFARLWFRGLEAKLTVLD